MNKQQFIDHLQTLNIKISAEQLTLLNRYYELLKTWNEKINLTSIIAKNDVYLKHFYDSLTLTRDYDFYDQKVCDIGTGAGFPGLVLKILFPNLNLTLVDSLEKRIKFLDLVVTELGLLNVITVHNRAEEYAKNHLSEFDVVTTRAVAKLNVLNELCLPLLKDGGVFLAMKANASEEIETSLKGLKILNSKIEKIDSFLLPIENSNRTIIKIIKIKAIDKEYPRNFDKIKKNPL